MSVRRFRFMIEEIRRDIEECERQIAYHLDEMQRAYHQGEEQIERHHRQEQLKWERKLRHSVRDLIHAERQLAKSIEEEHIHRLHEEEARREGKSRNTWW
ncbi:MAG: hypothetical protein WB502_05675 [Thermoactinomyces sp.]